MKKTLGQGPTDSKKKCWKKNNFKSVQNFQKISKFFEMKNVIVISFRFTGVGLYKIYIYIS